MTRPHDDHAIARAEDRLVRLVAPVAAEHAELAGDDAVAYAAWLAEEARLAATPLEQRRDARRARDFAARVLARRGLERVREGGLVVRAASAPAERAAAVRAHAADAVDATALADCAPLLDLRVAAGAGRALWEQACERWVELPPDIPRGRYVALGVHGDSMVPLLAPGDTMLVRLGDELAPGAVVVARLADDGYVVKQVGRTTARAIELRSLNAAYAPLRVRRGAGAVLGRVVLVWGRSAG